MLTRQVSMRRLQRIGPISGRGYKSPNQSPPVNSRQGGAFGTRGTLAPYFFL